MLTQSGAPGCVIGWSDFSRQPTMVNIHLDLSLIDLLLIFSIWMCHFDPVVSLGIESTIKLLSSYKMFSSCFLVSF